MPDLSLLYDWIPRLLPFNCLQARFMQQALVGLVLIAPLTAAMGVQVVNFRMAFFSDAVSHSAFAGVALGLFFSMNPNWTMLALGVLIGLGVTAVQRRSTLSFDTVIGVFYSAVIALGLALVSRERALARDLQRFLYGDILTIGDADILLLFLLFLLLMGFQVYGFNRLLYIGFNPTLAKTHRVATAAYQYAFAGLLSLIVMLSVRAVGVLLVTALLIVPAAAARNFARSAGNMFWWALIVSISSAVIGLLVSAQDWAATATGATIIIAACVWFALSALYAFVRGERDRR